LQLPQVAHAIDAEAFFLGFGQGGQEQGGQNGDDGDDTKSSIKVKPGQTETEPAMRRART
jgi:hypothetical protein